MQESPKFSTTPESMKDGAVPISEFDEVTNKQADYSVINDAIRDHDGSDPKLVQVSPDSEPYPRYERISPDGKVMKELSEPQRFDLRKAIINAGAGLFLLATPSDTGKSLDQEVSDNLQPDSVSVQEFNHSKESPVLEEQKFVQTETIETLELPDTFAAEVSGYKAMAKLRHDELLFKDQFNRPFGDPIKAEPIDLSKAGHEGLYKYTPGVFDEESGVLEGGWSKEWLEIQRAIVQDQNPELEIDQNEFFHVDVDFEKQLAETDEPKLIEGIKNGSIATYEDLLHYYGDKPVIGAEDYSRIDYVSKNIEFTPWNEEKGVGVPPVVEEELRRLIPGVCAEESRFNNGVISEADARGIFQVKPGTWGYMKGGDLDGYKSLIKQTKVVGRYYSDLYEDLNYFIGEENLGKLQRFSDEDKFQKDFMVPVLINSYNTGAKGMSEVVNYFVENIGTNSLEWRTGKELFLDIINFAKQSDNEEISHFGDDAREYVTKIYAQAEVLSEGQKSSE